MVEENCVDRHHHQSPILRHYSFARTNVRMNQFELIVVVEVVVVVEETEAFVMDHHFLADCKSSGTKRMVLVGTQFDVDYDHSSVAMHTFASCSSTISY